MCLIVFAWDAHPKYKLILAANRDEFYERPTQAAHFWRDYPTILGGRDLKAGGTWMVISKSGRFATVTNYRDPKNILDDRASRGEIPTNFVISDSSPAKYLEDLHTHAGDYNGFNTLISDQQTMLHYSNCQGTPNVITPGIHGLSNSLLDTPWPKVLKAKEKLETLMKSDFAHDDLLMIMDDRQLAEDHALPETGVSYELEKALSAMCIRTERYGTCCSTALTIDRDGFVSFTEKSYAVGDREEKTVTFEFQLP